MINKIVGWMTALFMAGVAVFLMVTMQLVVSVGMSRAGYSYKQYEGLFCFLYSILTIIVMFLFTNKKSPFAKSNSLRTSKFIGIEPFWLFVVALGLLGITTLYLVGVELLSEINSKVSEAADQYTESMDRFADVDEELVPNWDHWLYFISTFVLIPMAEELTFRGGVLESFRGLGKPWIAIGLSSLVFGLLHGISVHIIYALICGIALGAIYHVCESVWASYLVHATFNLFGASIMTLLQSGAVNVTEDITNRIYSAFYLSEIAAIVPAIVAFILIYQGRKSLSKVSEVTTNEQA